MDIRVRVIKEGFGYWDDHKVGEEFYMPLRHVTECIQKGYIEIVTNNIGNNLSYDEPVEGVVTEPIQAVNAPEPEPSTNGVRTMRYVTNRIAPVFKCHVVIEQLGGDIFKIIKHYREPIFTGTLVNRKDSEDYLNSDLRVCIVKIGGERVYNFKG